MSRLNPSTIQRPYQGQPSRGGTLLAQGQLPVPSRHVFTRTMWEILIDNMDSTTLSLVQNGLERMPSDYVLECLVNSGKELRPDSCTCFGLLNLLVQSQIVCRQWRYVQAHRCLHLRSAASAM